MICRACDVNVSLKGETFCQPCAIESIIPMIELCHGPPIGRWRSTPASEAASKAKGAARIAAIRAKFRA